ncbi:MAG: Phage integrase, partial [Acidimicrobiaceae bacterium]|nr:Phage integrase [Acidimicrobiaceae bacterium]
AESWWKTRAGHRPSTRVRDREALGRDVLPFFRDAQLGRLERADVQEWIDHLSQRLAPSTVRRTYVVLDQLLAVAVERGIIESSPAKGVQLPRIVRSEAHFLTPSELERLASAIQPGYRTMVLVMAWGTLHIGEASGLRRSDVNLAAGSIRIENNAVQVLGRPIEGPPKTKAGRRSMTLPSSIIEDLGAHLDRQPGGKYVFGPSGERPLLADDWRTHPWRRAVLAAELSPLRPHDLKHTGVALLALAGSIPRRSPDVPATLLSRSPMTGTGISSQRSTRRQRRSWSECDVQVATAHERHLSQVVLGLSLM